MKLLFAWRYFKAKKSVNAINIIAWISVVAIIIGTWALITVLSVFNGFEGLVKSLYSSFYTDIRISSDKGKFLTLTEEQLSKIRSIKGVKIVSTVLEEKALLQNGEYQSMVNLKGVDENYRLVSGVNNHLLGNGVYEIGTDSNARLILGVGVESALNVHSEMSFEPLRIIMPRMGEKEQLDIQEDISNDTIHTSAAFAIQQDFDNQYAITNIDFVKRATKRNQDEYTHIEILLDNPKHEKEIIKQLRSFLTADYKVQNKYQQNESLYTVMNMEKWAIYGVLSLILIVAAFNMIGALTMLVLEKKKDISVLHALGAPKKLIQGIFLTEGLLLAAIGGGIGIALAVLTVFAQSTFHIIPLTGGTFLIDYFPVQLKVEDLLLVVTTVIVIAIIASIIPAMKAGEQIHSLRTD